MNFGERIKYGVIGGTLLFSGETLMQLAHVIAEETITVRGTPIEIPTDVKLRGWTYSVTDDCLHEHPEDAEEYCRQMKKAVLRRGGTLGSVVLDTGEIIMVKGERDSFNFIDQALANQEALDNL